MYGGIGFHSHKVITGTVGDVNNRGSYLSAEVTSATNTLFYPNAFGYTEAGVLDVNSARRSDGIPLTAGVTRLIPMAIYNFKADDEVTVVVYGK